VTPRAALLVGLTGLLLAGAACQAPASHARADATRRWNAVRAQVKARLASEQLATGHISDAAAAVAEAVRLDPNNPHLTLLEARVCLAEGRGGRALVLLESIPIGSAPRAEADYLTGVLVQERGLLDDALVHYKRALEVRPDEVTHVLAVADVLQQVGRPREALELLEQHAVRFALLTAYQEALAECHEQLGNWEQAAGCWRRAFEPGERSPAQQERLALALLSAGRTAEAASLLAQLCSDPQTQSTGLRLALAKARLEHGHCDEALRELSQIADATQHPVASKLIIEGLARTGRTAQAFATARQALDADPSDAELLEWTATLALRAGDLAGARSWALRLRHAHPDAESPIIRLVLELTASADSSGP
jgi:tetratricopeptide (TPR) repeat protein